jgi:Calcineurin-like phosphoesterase
MLRREFLAAGLVIPASFCYARSVGKLVDQHHGGTLRLVDATFDNPPLGQRRYRGRDYVDLGRDNAARFRVWFPRTGYYRFKVLYGADVVQRPPRAAVLLDRRVLGTTYHLENHPADPGGDARAASVGDLGEHLVDAGTHELEIETLFEHGEALASVSITPVNRPVEKVRARFVQLTDTHIQKNIYHIWTNLKLCGDMPEVLAETGDMIRRLSPDFVMLTGDIVDADSPRSIRFAKQAIEPIPRPLFPVLGNHDTFRRNHANWLKTWEKEFPGDQVYYSFNSGGYHFVMLDCLLNRSAPLEKPQFSWLDADLAQHRDYPTFIAVHTPWGKKFAPQLKSRIKENPQIKAVISGHAHISGLSAKAGCVYSVSAALVEYPMMFREFVIFEKHLEIRSYQVSRALQRKSFMTVEEKVAFARKHKRKPNHRHTKIWNHMLGSNSVVNTELGKEYITA